MSLSNIWVISLHCLLWLPAINFKFKRYLISCDIWEAGGVAGQGVATTRIRGKHASKSVNFVQLCWTSFFFSSRSLKENKLLLVFTLFDYKIVFRSFFAKITLRQIMIIERCVSDIWSYLHETLWNCCNCIIWENMLHVANKGEQHDFINYWGRKTF